MVIDVVIREGLDATSIHWEAPSGPPKVEVEGNLIRHPDPDGDLKDILGVFARSLRGAGWDGWYQELGYRVRQRRGFVE